MDYYLIPASFLSVIFFLAFAVKLAERQWEHAITRFIVGAVYLVLTVDPSISVDTARFLARWAYLLLGGIELLSWAIIKMQNARRKLHEPR